MISRRLSRKATTIIMVVAYTMLVTPGRIRLPTSVPSDSPAPPRAYSILAPGVGVTSCRSLIPQMPFCCAYDISIDACKTLKAHASAAGVDSQRLLVTSNLDDARAAGPYDLALSLFGVLSHIEEPENRMKILNSIHSLLARGGLFLVTVPNACRRFPLHISQVSHDNKVRDIRYRRASMRRYFPWPRLVIYRHHIENVQRLFPYHLFSRGELARELSAAGFFVEILESDSILPERRLVRNRALEPVDNLLCQLLPSWAGYGLRAVCRVGPV